jgi:thiol-disulfide isomerase/thioredoxin
MKNFYIFVLTFGLSFLMTSQEFEGSFNVAIKKHIKRYNIKSDIAYENKDPETAQVLFDSLVSNHLVGTNFDDFTFKGFATKNTKLSSYKKPIFILTYASWCIPSKGEIPALNKLAQKYAKDVKFIILFWDKKNKIKSIARKFNHSISVCYAHESYKNDATIVANLKHTLGFPTSYFLDEKLRVVNIKRGGAQPPSKSSYVKAYTMNYNIFREGLGSLLIEKNISSEQLTTN